MAAKKKSVDVVDLLKQIDVGIVNRVTKEQAALLGTLVETNVNDIVDDKALVRLTDEGKKMISGNESAPVSNGAGYEIMTGVGLPPRKRVGRTSGVTKYPFDSLQVGNTFFVAGADQVKKLASTISAQNMKYSVPTGEKENKERTKRGPGNKAVLDELGNKVKEVVSVEKRRPTRKFSMRGVKAGQVIDGWTVPNDGVLIGREV